MRKRKNFLSTTPRMLALNSLISTEPVFAALLHYVCHKYGLMKLEHVHQWVVSAVVYFGYTLLSATIAVPTRVCLPFRLQRRLSSKSFVGALVMKAVSDSVKIKTLLMVVALCLCIILVCQSILSVHCRPYCLTCLCSVLSLRVRARQSLCLYRMCATDCGCLLE